MRPLPIPDGVAESMGGQRMVIGEGDPTRDDVRPCEYVVAASLLYPGRPIVCALVEVSEEEREWIAGGANLWLILDGGELPWSLRVDGMPA